MGIESIPGMFARPYVAPPQEVLWNMFDNDMDFDDAIQNVIDREIELSYADDPFDYDAEDGLEKAIYQFYTGTENGIDPAEISETPYGQSLTQEELDLFAEEYPGIGGGFNLNSVSELFDSATNFLSLAGKGVDDIIDAEVIDV